MMEFVLMTISLTIALLLAGVIGTIAVFAIVSRPKVIKWYMNWVNKMTTSYIDELAFTEEEEKL